jgi:transketolase N-terminal domain/subunit
LYYGQCDFNFKSGIIKIGDKNDVFLNTLKYKRNENKKVFCIVGDGEANEGSIWEAIMFASHFKLENLFVIIKFMLRGYNIKDIYKKGAFSAG